jgi:hypothetical protein
MRGRNLSVKRGEDKEVKGETILCIATTRWHSLWRNSQQIMSRIATQNCVLYFEPGRNPDRPLRSEMVGNLPNFARLRAETVRENLTVIPMPTTLPYGRQHLPRVALRYWTPLVAKLNARVLSLQIRRAIRQFNVRAPILWLFEPRDIDLIGQFDEKLVVYYNYDELSEFKQNARMKDLLRAYDNRLCQKADVTFCTSHGQWERRRQINANTYLSPNAVNFELFNRALDPATPIPPDAANLRHPIIGFAGWLGYQFDADLVLHVARQFPDCTVLLVGPDNLSESEVRRQLHAQPNVVFVGQKKLDELPSYLKVFDAALIPYELRGHTVTAYPLNLHEYLAGGRSVVSTAMPEMRVFNHIIRVAESYDQYVQYVREALTDHSPEAVQARVALARQNTWDQRIVEIYAAMERVMVAKGERIENQLHRLDTVQPSH